MHRGFSISEILDLIFAQLQSPCPNEFDRDARNESLGRRHFAALARTCKTFQNPALDFLWREQDTLTNLLKCLPSHLWEEEAGSSNVWEEEAESPNRIRITGPIQPSDWEKPLSYALRIQRLQLDAWSMMEDFPAADVFERISSGLPRDHLCPNLRGILFHVTPKADSLFPYIRLFLGPKIIDVSISLPFSSSHAPSLSFLPIRYPHLKKLYLSAYYPQDEPDILSKIALTLDRIESLTLNKLDRVAIEHISQLPALKSLRLQTSHSEDLGLSLRFPTVMGAQTPPFPALRDVSFEEATTEFALEFLDLLSTCCVANFHVGTTDVVTKLTTSRLYATLAGHLSHSALKILRVERAGNCDDPTVPEDMANHAIDGHILAKLFCFANLTKIILAPPVGFNIDDATAWDIARAWPKLKILTLTAATDLHHPPGMSLHGLQAFAKHCRELTSLMITFDASTVPPRDDSPDPIISQFSLTSLDVDTSPITDPTAVAQFTSGLFPNLANIWTHDNWIWDEVDIQAILMDDGVAYGQFTRWKKVEAMLPKSKGATEALEAVAS